MQDGVVRVQGDEFWHMTKVLRLGNDDRYPLLSLSNIYLSMLLGTCFLVMPLESCVYSVVFGVKLENADISFDCFGTSFHL